MTYLESACATRLLSRSTPAATTITGEPFPSLARGNNFLFRNFIILLLFHIVNSLSFCLFKVILNHLERDPRPPHHLRHLL